MEPTGELQEKAQALADLAVREGLQGALSFKWNHEPKILVVTPHPDSTVACEDAPPAP